MAIETISVVDRAGKRSVAASSVGDTGSVEGESTAPPIRLGKRKVLVEVSTVFANGRAPGGL